MFDLGGGSVVTRPWTPTTARAMGRGPAAHARQSARQHTAGVPGKIAATPASSRLQMRALHVEEGGDKSAAAHHGYRPRSIPASGCSEIDANLADVLTLRFLQAERLGHLEPGRLAQGFELEIAQLDLERGQVLVHMLE
jgi:hypothetical protein